MNEEEIKKNDGEFLRVISIFLLLFSLLVFMAVFLTEGTAAKITNLVCSIMLAGIASIFYYGYRKNEKK